MTNAGQVSALPGFADGSWWVQDAAAALPVRLLGDISGKTAIDLCCAPGGKTMQLAAAGGKVMAVDNSQTRMGRVKENLERTGLVARTKIKDALQTVGEFDVVVLDAPCSATGTMRRHPDLPHAKDGSDFGALIELQSQLLDHAIGLLKPGGRLVYCTCSLLPDEGECQVEEALARHQNLQIDQAAMNVDFIDPQMRSDEGGLRLTPDMLGDNGGLDGFYIAVLTKT
jgi:16S rRNA (cytosine967-C5)-methyltransferase